MPRVSFDELPSHGRLWVFPCTRELSDVEAATLLEAVDAFLDEWAAHGAPLRSGRDLLERRFLLVGVDEDAEAPSGCSIDALVNRLRGLGGEIGADLLGHTPVFFRDEGSVRSTSRSEFRALAEAGEVDARTRVFDTTLTRIGDFRDGGLERPVAQSWHARAFLQHHGVS